MSQTTLVEALQYPIDVVEGRIVACELTILACERFLNDLKRAKTDENLRFNKAKARRALKFFGLSCHVKGSLAGQPIKLMPWAAWIVANLHGFELKRSGVWTRRFRKFYTEVARKNAKSTLLSGLGLYATGFDGEGGAEVYAAATTRDQARIVYGDAAEMVRRSPALKLLFKPLRNEVKEKNGSSTFRPLSSDANTLDGLNTHFAAIDEYHSHKTSEVYDVIESSTGARLNPMIGIITTAGFNLQSPCYMLRKQYIEPLLRGDIEDDSYFAAVYTLDEGDDPFDEKNWIKANPGLGASKQIDTMREEAKKAAHMPTAKANFLTKHCNVWVQSSSSFIDLEDFKRCLKSVSDDELAGVPCYIALDLARLWDWTAVVAVFKMDDGTYDVRPFMFLPEDTLNKVTPQLRQIYDRFVNDGCLTLTEGNVIDHRIISEKILELCKKYNVREVCFDAYNSSSVLNDISNAGVELVSVSQGARGLSAGMNEVQARVLNGTLRNPDNSAFTWHLGNVVLKHEEAKNMIPTKENNASKIDAAVALIMAVGRALKDGDADISGFINANNFIPV